MTSARPHADVTRNLLEIKDKDERDVLGQRIGG